MSCPQDLKYTKDHEWTRVRGKTVIVGITHFAQDKLGDVVFVELPKAGAIVKAGETFGVVESTKAVSDLFAPVSGTVVKVNAALVDEPSTVNKDPYDKGWMIEIELSDEKELAALLDAKAYEALLATEAH